MKILTKENKLFGIAELVDGYVVIYSDCDKIRGDHPICKRRYGFKNLFFFMQRSLSCDDLVDLFYDLDLMEVEDVNVFNGKFLRHLSDKDTKKFFKKLERINRLDIV